MKKNNSVNKSKLEALKKEVIEILKNQAEKEYKKALNHFLKEEENYSYLTKSISGEWIEKAGYPVGTVREWKGKKYRKIAPDKWARMYESKGRGTNIAVGKLIAKVKKIDNVEDLMKFCLEHKQRFEDTNVLDKIRAAVDEQNEKLSGGTVESKGKPENTEKKEYEYYKHNLSEKDDLETILKDIKEEREYYNKHKDVKGAEKRLKELSAKENVVNELLENTAKKEETPEENRALDIIKKYAGKTINKNPIKITQILDDGKRSGFFTFEFSSGKEKYEMTYDRGFGGKKGGVTIKKIESGKNTLTREDMKEMSKEVGDINSQEIMEKISKEESNKKYDELYKKYFPIEPKIIKDAKDKWLSKVDNNKITDELVKNAKDQAKKMNDVMLLNKLEEFKNRKPIDINVKNEQDFKHWVLNHISNKSSYRKTVDDAMSDFHIPYDPKAGNTNEKNELALSILEKEAKQRGLIEDNKESKPVKKDEKQQNNKQGELPSGYVNDLSIEKQGELLKLLKEHFKKEGMSGMEIAYALDNAMDSKISDLEEIYNTNKEVKELLMNTDLSSFKLSDIYDSNVHDEMKRVQSFDEAKNVIKQIADNYGATEKGRKLLENFMSYNVGGSSPIYDKVYEHFGISYNDADADFDAVKNKILKLASGQKNVSKEDEEIQQAKDDFASRYRAAIEQEDKNFQKNEKSKKAKIKKSLEDILLLLNEDEEEEDYNDYSAENPELFNSVAYRVANAFDECGY